MKSKIVSKWEVVGAIGTESAFFQKPANKVKAIERNNRHGQKEKYAAAVEIFIRNILLKGNGISLTNLGTVNREGD